MIGISLSLLICSYGFGKAEYQLKSSDVVKLNILELSNPNNVVDKIYYDDVSFKNDIRNLIGTNEFSKREGEILELSIRINSILVLLGIMDLLPVLLFLLDQLCGLCFLSYFQICTEV